MSLPAARLNSQALVIDQRPRCWRCGRLLAEHAARPWCIVCGRCKAHNASEPA